MKYLLYTYLFVALLARSVMTGNQNSRIYNERYLRDTSARSQRLIRSNSFPLIRQNTNALVTGYDHLSDNLKHKISSNLNIQDKASLAMTNKDNARIQKDYIKQLESPHTPLEKLGPLLIKYTYEKKSDSKSGWLHNFIGYSRPKQWSPDALSELFDKFKTTPIDIKILSNLLKQMSPNVASGVVRGLSNIIDQMDSRSANRIECMILNNVWISMERNHQPFPNPLQCCDLNGIECEQGRVSKISWLGLRERINPLIGLLTQLGKVNRDGNELTDFQEVFRNLELL